MRNSVRTYPSTPKGFDPRVATPDELRRHGLPPRPDPKTHPEQSRLWELAFARPVRFHRARLAIDPVMSQRNPLAGASVDDTRFPTGSWAGVTKLMQLDPADDFQHPAAMVFAQWVVPSVSPVHRSGNDLTVAAWVGLDGHPSLGVPAAKQVLQAGVAVTVTDTGFLFWEHTVVKFWAWTEWYTDTDECHARKIENFPVAGGDTIFVVVCAPQPDFGYASLLNLTRGRGVSVGIPAQPGITAYGRSAEWIVESVGPYIPAFWPVVFTKCTAGSLATEIFHADGGLISELSEFVGPGPYATKEFTHTTITGPETVVVELVATDWF